jgi:hypothetical protein
MGYELDITFVGAVHRRVDLTWGQTRYQGPDQEGPADDFAINLGLVERMLTAIDAGVVTATEARETLLQLAASTYQRSGCCPDREDSFDVYERVLAQYAAAKAEVERRSVEMTGETHPYKISGNGTVHAFDCRTVPDVELVHPGETISAFVHGEFGRHTGFNYQPFGSIRRITADELAEAIRSRGRQPRRCRTCQPALPVAYTSEAMDVG